MFVLLFAFALFLCMASELHYELMQLLTKMLKAITILGRLGFLAKLPICRHQGRSPSREILFSSLFTQKATKTDLPIPKITHYAHI